MNPCPGEVELERFLAGTLDTAGSAALERHATSCAACSSWLAEARSDDAILDDVVRVSARAAPGAGRSPDAGALDDEAPAPDRYRVLRRLGAGGVGVVWEAEQRRPRRRVALKVLRGSSVTPRALARFSFEADALARLDHPGIARVFEAGVYETRGERRPYLALELVEGRPLDRWLAEERPVLRRRLELFLALCGAVGHAHRRGLVHRDLKPANVLVDAEGRPKVLDFGVARALDADAGATLTGAGELVGTLPYASPEQVAGDPAAVDTRADVHALGLILFELSTGRRAFELGDVPVAEAVRRVREEAPPPLRSLDPSLTRDLEVIVARALEKDPERRTPSVEALAADVRAHLEDRPIGARPPGTLESLARFTRKHRALVGGAATTVAALVLGLIGVVAMLVRARAAESEAREDEARARAESRAADAAIGFLTGILGGNRALWDTRDVTVREALARAEARLDADEIEEPAVEAAVRLAIGTTLAGLGEHGRAGEQLEAAVALRRELDGPRSLRYAGALNALGALDYEAGELELAEDAYREVLSIHAEHPGERVQEEATTQYNLGILLWRRGELEEAEKLLSASIETVRPRVEVYPDLLGARLQIASLVAFDRGDPSRALSLLQEALEVVETHLPADDPNVQRLRESFARALVDAGDSERAAELRARWHTDPERE